MGETINHKAGLVTESADPIQGDTWQTDRSDPAGLEIGSRRNPGGVIRWQAASDHNQKARLCTSAVSPIVLSLYAKEFILKIYGTTEKWDMPKHYVKKDKKRIYEKK